MSPRRDKRRYGRTAKDVRRGGLGTHGVGVGPAIKELDLWLRVNGTDVVGSNVVQAITSLSEREVVSSVHLVQLQAGDYIEVMFAVNDLNLILNAFASDAVSPATPSITLNITQVR